MPNWRRTAGDEGAALRRQGAAVTLLDGRLLIAEAVRTIRPATSVVWLTWPESGERRQLLRAGGETLFYLGGLLWHAALPPGWLLVQVSEPSGILAVRAADGSSVDLVQPHLDMPRPPAAVGSAG